MEQSIYYKKITPEHKWYDLRLKEVWRYRDLVMLLVKRDFVAKYKQTILGPAWAVIQPLLTTVVFKQAGPLSITAPSWKKYIFPEWQCRFQPA